MSKPLESDLKPGLTVLVDTAGRKALYLGDEVCVYLDSGLNGSVSWDKYRDIAIKKIYFVSRKDHWFSLDEGRGSEVVYTATPPKEVTMSEVEEKFGCKVKIVKD